MAGKLAEIVREPGVVGITVTPQVDVEEVAGTSVQFAAESPGSPLSATIPEGLEEVPPDWVSVTVTVTGTAWPTTAGLAPKLTSVDVVRAATVIVMDWVEDSGVLLPSAGTRHTPA